MARNHSTSGKGWIQLAQSKCSQNEQGNLSSPPVLPCAVSCVYESSILSVRLDSIQEGLVLIKEEQLFLFFFKLISESVNVAFALVVSLL